MIANDPRDARPYEAVRPAVVCSIWRDFLIFLSRWQLGVIKLFREHYEDSIQYLEEASNRRDDNSSTWINMAVSIYMVRGFLELLY